MEISIVWKGASLRDQDVASGDLLNNIAETTECTMADVENADMIEVAKNDKLKLWIVLLIRVIMWSMLEG
jgi:hypothetical protein